MQEVLAASIIFSREMGLTKEQARAIAIHVLTIKGFGYVEAFNLAMGQGSQGVPRRPRNPSITLAASAAHADQAGNGAGSTTEPRQ